MMIKRCLIVILLSCAICLCACSRGGVSNLSVSPDNVESSYVGEYKLYETMSKLEYLAFLNNLDTQKYEVINIDTGYFMIGFDLNEYYMVTYKQVLE